MNKYDKEFMKIEKKSDIKAKMQNKFLNMKIFKKMYNFNSLIVDENLFYYIIFCLCDNSEELIEWIIKDILPSLNKSYLITIFLMELCYRTYEDDKSIQKKYMESMKIAGLVKDIFYDDFTKTYIIINMQDKKYQVSPLHDNKETAKKHLRYCHYYTEKALNCFDIDIFGCCVLFYDLFNNPHYHSFVIKDTDNVVIDFSHNIKTSFEFYTEELGYNVLLKEEKNKILEGIEELRITDRDFNKSQNNSFLKYVINEKRNK